VEQGGVGDNPLQSFYDVICISKSLLPSSVYRSLEKYDEDKEVAFSYEMHELELNRIYDSLIALCSSPTF
jgi:hypothetical protein